MKLDNDKEVSDLKRVKPSNPFQINSGKNSVKLVNEDEYNLKSNLNQEEIDLITLYRKVKFH
jgi:hypothetical protein